MSMLKFFKERNSLLSTKWKKLVSNSRCKPSKLTLRNDTRIVPSSVTSLVREWICKKINSPQKLYTFVRASPLINQWSYSDTSEFIHHWGRSCRDSGGSTYSEAYNSSLRQPVLIRQKGVCVPFFKNFNKLENLKTILGVLYLYERYVE